MHGGGSRRDVGRGPRRTNRARAGAAWVAALVMGTLAFAAFGVTTTAVAGGSTPTTNAPSTGVEALTSVPTNNFWLASPQGAVWNFGSAVSYGSAAGLPLNHPIVAITPTNDAGGYWLVATDGGIFSYGDASFYGSTGSITLNKPIVGMSPTPDGKGYWMVASDGGIFSYGDAAFYGSPAGGPGLDPTEKVVSTHSGQGYWVEAQNGTAYPFGDAQGTPPTEGLMFSPTTPGDKAVSFAFAQLGKPYIWGGNGPAGYDCSGLVLASWQHGAGVTFARVANDQYNTAGSPVALTTLAAGDLLFWGSSQTDWTSVYHAAMYVGGNQIVEATGDHVQLNSLDQWGLSDLMANGRRP
jgi:cell wall-associated NlpC family hydrolase